MQTGNIISIKTIGLPPTINHTYISSCIGGRVRVFKTTDAKAFQEQLRLSIAGRVLPITKWYGIVMHFIQPNNRRDIDNGQKIILDGVCTGLGINDNQLLYSITTKTVNKELEPCVEVHIGPALELLDLIPSINQQINEYLVGQRDKIP